MQLLYDNEINKIKNLYSDVIPSDVRYYSNDDNKKTNVDVAGLLLDNNHVFICFNDDQNIDLSNPCFIILDGSSYDENKKLLHSNGYKPIDVISIKLKINNRRK